MDFSSVEPPEKNKYFCKIKGNQRFLLLKTMLCFLYFCIHFENSLKEECKPIQFCDEIHKNKTFLAYCHCMTRFYILLDCVLFQKLTEGGVQTGKIL